MYRFTIIHVFREINRDILWMPTNSPWNKINCQYAKQIHNTIQLLRKWVQNPYARRHNIMETLSALLALCEWKPFVTRGFRTTLSDTAIFVIFIVSLLNKPSICRWSNTPRRLCDVTVMRYVRNLNTCILCSRMLSWNHWIPRIPIWMLPNHSQI